MDCSICTTMPFILRPPRNTICAACYEGARSIISVINKFDGDKSTPAGAAGSHHHIDKYIISSSNSTAASISSTSSNSAAKGLGNVLKWVKEMKDLEEELTQKLCFLGGFESAFRDQIHTDIKIKPGDGGPPIPAHKALLVSKSVIFKNIFDSDTCKAAAPKDETITLPELTHDELHSLLEFLYSGNLSPEKAEKHVYSLSVAADKYEIPFLGSFCERQMLGSLGPSTVLDVLEISDVCSNQSLKDTALNFIVKNMEDVVFSTRFETFALKNPHLCVQITRASLMDLKSRRIGL